jgi:RNA polymerase sigma-B factor
LDRPKPKSRVSDDYSDVVDTIGRLRGMAAKAPETERLREDVITRCLPLAENIARRFSGRGENHDDLVQVARLGLVNAVDRFDPEHGSEFVSFAVPTIMGEVRRHFRDAAWATRVPRRLKELHKSISDASENLSQRLGRSPSASEIAAELDLDVAEVTEGLLARGAYQALSTDSGAADDEIGAPLLETLGSDDPEYEHVESYVAIRPALAKLTERERRILVLRFFGSQTQTEIAKQLGISQMHVSRILASTLVKLRNELGPDGPDDDNAFLR